MKRKVLFSIIAIALIILALIIYSASTSSEKALSIFSKVEQGKFEVLVAVTGELRAQRSIEIRAPNELRNRSMRVSSVTLLDIVPEGTLVDSGDWVATLDRTEIDLELKNLMDEIELRREADFLKTQLDTSIQLRQLRNDLVNLKFNRDEMEIALEQSQFEPPATIRQAQFNLDKANRAYDQALTNYDLKVEQAKAAMTDVIINLDRARRTKTEIEEILQKFEIKAPASGMVIYKRERNGQKRTVGSQINLWDLVVAELPDLSVLNSRTFVNEIDISKIKPGQLVRLGVDAFPEKEYSGVVREVANIGEQLPNTDAKVFEVVIRLNEKDDILRPSMTTSNQIITKEYDDVLYIPLETVYSNDSVSYVFRKSGVKQIVVLGEANENFIIVEKGLKAGDELYLSMPSQPELFRFEGLEFIPELKQRKEEKARLDSLRQLQNEDIENRRHGFNGERGRPDGEYGDRMRMNRENGERRRPSQQ